MILFIIYNILWLSFFVHFVVTVGYNVDYDAKREER